MTMTNTRPGSTSEVIGAGLTGTARTTGLLYLGLAVTGFSGSMLVRGQTLRRRRRPRHVVQPGRTRVDGAPRHRPRAGHRADPGPGGRVVLPPVPQRRHVRRGLVAVFGMVNAVAILGSAAMLATALDVADDRSLAVSGGAAATVQLLYVISGHLWGVAGLFFGLWLIPMGWLVVRSRWLPRPLGLVLMVGGVGYVLSTFVSYRSRMPISWPGC